MPVVPNATLHFPMPQPGARGAPNFKGKMVSDFLTNLQSTGKAAGLTDAELPPQILRYSNRKVKRIIGNDAVFTGADWDVACERLKSLFSAGEVKRKIAPRRLQDFVDEWLRKGKVRSLSSFERYNQGFLERLGDMLTTNKVRSDQVDLWFCSGLPRRLRKELKVELNDTVQGTMSGTNPPPMESVNRVVRAYFEEDGMDGWTKTMKKKSSVSGSDEEDSDDIYKYSSDEEPNSSDEESGESESEEDEKRKKKKRASKKKGKGKERDQGSNETTKELKVISGSLQTLVTALNAAKLTGQPMMPSHAQVAYPVPTMQYPMAPQQHMPYQPPQQQPQVTFPQPQGPRRCYICDGLEGYGLQHKIGFRYCPEFDKLLAEGLIKCLDTGKLVKADGSGLPRVLPNAGGIAGQLRAERSTSQGKEREVPPHMPAGNAYGTCNNLGLFKDDKKVLSEGVFAVASEEYETFPVQTRSKAKEKEREEGEKAVDTERKVRFEITHKEDGAAKPHVQVLKPHPINTEEGWRAKRSEDRTKRAQEDKGKTSIRYTSDVQDTVSIDAIQDMILNTKVTLPLRDIIGMSAELQKRFSSITKTRREVRTSATVVEELEDDESRYVVEESEDEEGTPQEIGYGVQLTYDQETEDLEEIIERYAAAVAIGPRRFFAMATGIVSGYFGATKVTYLVDSGSELNLISKSAFDRSNVDLDEDGARWALKGITGEAVGLLGCCKNASVELSGLFFNHHFFVTPQDSGNFDGVLGQPWLQWFAARIDYERHTGAMDLCIWPDGSKTGRRLTIRLTGSRQSSSQPNLGPKGKRQQTVGKEDF